MSRKSSLAVLGFIFFVQSVSMSFGQASLGAVLGSVADTSGAAIPGAQVTVVNEGTNQTREIVTNETGNYRIESLQVGLYSVSAELPGFRKEIRKGVKVDVDAKIRLDFRLEVGAVTESVEVLGSAPIVQTDSSELGTVVDQRKIDELPLNGRQFVQLAYLTPGTFAPRPSSMLGFRGGFVAIGIEEKANQYLLDGINNNGGMMMEMVSYPNIDAIAEMKVQTQNYGSQYGRFAGAQVDAITKSGTNQFHGSVFGYARLNSLDARNFFDPYPLTANNKSTFSRKQYGGVLGGPIIKDKLFFFVGFQGQRQLQRQRTTPTVPFPEYWSGDLSRLHKTIKDPLTGQPFLNSQIPANRISPITLNYRPLYPLPTSDAFSGNSGAVIPIVENNWQPNFKINYNPNGSHQIIGSYNLFAVPDNLEWVYSGRLDLPGFSLFGPIRNQAISLQHIWTSTGFVNEFRAGLSRINRDRRAEDHSKNFAQAFGINGTIGDLTPIAWQVPQSTISGYSSLGRSGVEPDRIDGNLMATDMISLQRGNQAIKIGGDIFQQYARYWSLSNGSFDFTGQATGDPFADFLLGLPNTTTRSLPSGILAPAYPRRLSTNYFVQDDWKVSRNLTLNIGLRYEIQFPLDELYGKLAGFDPSTGGMRVLKKNSGPHPYQSSLDTYKALFPNLAIQFVDRFHKVDANNFAPRFGLAWTPGSSGKTVVRTGYGIFYNVDALCFCSQMSGAPWYVAERFTAANGATLANPWPGRGVAGTITLAGVDPNLVSAYFSHWNLDLQQSLPGGIALDVAYIGKAGHKISTDRNLNQAVKGVAPYPLFSTINWLEPRGNSIYHGLQVRVERRATNGITLLTSYAWGHLIDDEHYSRGAAVQNTYNLSAEREPGMEDMRHRITISAIYSSPFGKGHRFLNSSAGDAILGNWEISSIFRANTGIPFTPLLSGDPCGSGVTGACRPNIIGDPHLANPNPRTGWWNPAAFSLPTAGTFGTAGRGSIYGPGYSAVDLSMMKRFNVGEGGRAFQFRWEIFNAFNRVNLFDNPIATFNTPTFGTIPAANNSRQMQAGLRFIF